MAFMNVGRENSTHIDLYYEDHGKGRPVVLIHGWPLSGRSWEKQVPVLLQAGYRVITYDRRGFGGSSKPSGGYDYDTLAADLAALLNALELRDVTLVGFSMGGGEVARYFGKYGRARIRNAVLMSTNTPFLLRSPDNPDGLDCGVFEEMQKAIVADRYAYLTSLFTRFYDFEALVGTRVSPEAARASWHVAAGASPTAMLDCASAWTTDLRKDLALIRVPALVLHGDADRICPIDATARPTHGAIPLSRLSVLKGAPHGLNWTHASDVNRELLEFLDSRSVTDRAP